MEQLIKLVNELKALQKNLNSPILIGLDGIGGSGKSTLASKLVQEIGGTFISLDDFRSKEIYEVDRERLINTLLAPLSESKSTHYQKWLWGENKLSDLIKVKPDNFIIFEGVTALHPELRDFYDYKIWIEVNADTAYKRGLDRDRNDYGVDTKSEWETQWIPYEQEYIRKYNPQHAANFTYNLN